MAVVNKVQSKVPQLRFLEFSGEWNTHFLKGLSKTGFSNGVFNDKNKVGSGYKLINVKDMYEGDSINIDTLTLLQVDEPEFKRNQVSFGDIFFTRSSIVAAGIAYSNINLSSDSDITFDGHLMRMSPDTKKVEPEFLAINLRSQKPRRQFIARAKVSTMATIGQDDIASVKISAPMLPEQNKIASFLSTVDKKISLLKQKHEQLVQYKKGVMQQLFSQQLRFKYDNGQDFPDWEDKKLNTLLTEHKKRNRDLKYNKGDVLSVSGELGVINQIEHLGRSYAGESVRDYHIVHEGDIVYTKSPLKANPYGIIKANKGKAGIVSTLYAVYSCKNTANYEYLEYYFWIDANTNRYLRPLVQKGAKNDMKINNQRVLIDRISVPSKQEQDKIVKFLKALDEKIFLAGQQLEQTQAYKQGLLQQMFV